MNTPGARSRLRDIMTDSNGAQLLDNYTECASSGHGAIANQCFQFIRQFQVLPPEDVRVPGCNPNDVALFVSAQETFYTRCVKDLSIITTILHRRFHCCRNVSCSSHNPYRYMAASNRLDILITILEWIVSEYVLVPIPNSYDTRRLCMARYDQFPYKGLLAQAYNLRLYQSNVHLRKSAFF